MKREYGDFAQSVMHNKNKNDIDMTFTGVPTLDSFTGMTTSKNFEEYKKTCDFKEKVICLYFAKALAAYQSCSKMYYYVITNKSLIGKRIDSEIITQRNISYYISEIYHSFYDALVALELIATDENILYKIADNSTKAFEYKMEQISEKTGVDIYGI